MSIKEGWIWYLDTHPDECPMCHICITPNKVHGELKDSNNVRMLFRCTNSECREIFISYYEKDGGLFYLNKSAPMNYVRVDFDSEIQGISPEFIEIYNQALKAEEMWLEKIAGMWFRKSLEFLIKDYLISLTPDEEEQIKEEFLWKAINDRIEDAEIKEISKRATWLWNDETHYVKKWEDKDINDLKILIDIVQSFISKKQKAKKYLESMI